VTDLARADVLVDAAPVRAHLRALRWAGVGCTSIEAACDVSKTTVRNVLSGRQRVLRAATAQRLLSVDAGAADDRSSIPAGPTRALIGELLSAGLTRGEIALRLGLKTRELRLGERGRVWAITAVRIRSLHAKIMATRRPGEFRRDRADPRYVRAAEARRLFAQIRAAGITWAEIIERLGTFYRPRSARVTPRSLAKLRALHAEVMRGRKVELAASAICRGCGQSHAPMARQTVVRRMVPCSAADLREAHPCWWAGIAGDRALYRDLRAVGAVRAAGRWAIPERRAA